MTDAAWIRNLEPRRGGGCDELERMCADIDIGDRLLNFGHVAANALVSHTASHMMRVSLDARRVRTVRGIGTVALQAQHVRWFYQIGVILGAVDIVATKATHSMGVHLALDEVVALHSVLVRCAIGEMGK